MEAPEVERNHSPDDGVAGVGKVGEAFTYAFGVVFFAAALYYLSGIVPYQQIFSYLANLGS